MRIAQTNPQTPERKRCFTPNDLEVLLHYHIECVPHPRLQVPAVEQAVKMWVKEGMLERSRMIDPTDSGYATTRKAHVWLMHLLSEPLPENTWEVPKR